MKNLKMNCFGPMELLLVDIIDSNISLRQTQLSVNFKLLQSFTLEIRKKIFFSNQINRKFIEIFGTIYIHRGVDKCC